MEKGKGIIDFNIVKQVEESNKKRKLEEKQIKMKNEMVNYFETKE